MIIGITGKAGSGKDTFANYLMTYFIKKKKVYTIKHFATPLKECSAILLGIPSYELNKEEIKDYVLNDYNITIREFMQILGTEIIRKINRDIFVDTLFRRNKGINNIIIPDVRFVNEAKAIKEKKGIIIKVIKKDQQYSKIHEHESEIEMEEILADYTIEANPGDFDKLESEAKRIVEELC